MNVDQIEFNRLTGNRDVLPTFVGICVGLAQTDVANKPDHSLSNEWPRQKKTMAIQKYKNEYKFNVNDW